MKIKTLIIEDEEDGRIALEKTCALYAPKINIIGGEKSLQEAANFITKNKVDLVFLDIHLGGDNGMDFFKIFPDPDFQVVFTTAYSEYAVEAFRTKAIDYLLKPIDIDDLQRAVKNVENAMDENKADAQNDKILVHTNRGYDIINASKLIRCEANGSYTTLYFDNSSKTVLAKNLKALEEILNKNCFIRIHRSHIINVNYLSRIDGNNAILENETSVPISSKKVDELIRFLS
ncbi:MAG: LytTR family DNA-binding domain-containing protein [Crocinitomicaceae bacterium]|nr:LytTR family DNA-binding domain-containing protein [Crocinitomicaceae bacterium]